MLVLIGGGWNPVAWPALYGPFIAAAAARSVRPTPSIACVVIDEGDGAAEYDRWRTALDSVGGATSFPVLVPLGRLLDVADLSDADGLLVCGGLTPAYADALSPVAEELRQWLADRPYAGFSAGAVVASARALVGGYLHDGRAVCPDFAAEDLDEVTVVDGLGLVAPMIDVHAAQWGTLGRLAAVLSSGTGHGITGHGIAIDDDTAIVISDSGATVVGLGAVHVMRALHGEIAAGRHVVGAAIHPALF